MSDRTVERIAGVLIIFMCLYLLGHLFVAGVRGSLWDSEPAPQVVTTKEG